MTTLDLRLLPAAIALWAGSAIGLHTGLGQRLPQVLLIVVLLGMLVRRRAATAWCLAMGLGIFIAALRVDAAAPPVIADAVANAGAVHFEAVIDATPRLIEDRGFGGVEVQPVIRAQATLVTLQVHDRVWHTAMPVTLQWPSEGPAISVGQRVSGAAVLHADDPATRSAYRISLRRAPVVTARESRGTWLATHVREGLARATHAADGGSGAALLPGLVLGDTRAQSAVLVDDLRMSGLSHLVAVSGANLAIVITAVLWGLRRTRLRAMHRHIVALLCIVMFVAVVQPQPSVVRAAVMGGVGVLAMATGNRRASASVLWLTTVVLLVLDPFLAWQYGFALSVAATAGLIVLRPMLARFVPDGWFGDALVVTLSAQIATLPVLLMMGRPPTWVSIPANLLCEPLVAPATVFGFIAALVAALALLPLPGIASGLFMLASLIALPGVAIASVIARIASIGAASPFAVAPISSLWVFLVVCAVVGLLLRMGLRGKWLSAALLVYVLVSSCAPQVLHRWPPDGWWYVMCDVGQGDASVFNLGDGRAIVVDAGPDPAAVRSCLRSLGVHEVSALILTHFHADHVEGVRGIRQQAHVARAYATPLQEPRSEWTRTRRELGIPIRPLVAGDALRIASTRIEVLWPVPGLLDGTPNNGSLVLDVARGAHHVLVTGDADAAAQAALRLPRRGYVLLKVAHHGSRYQDPGFIARVRPAIAFVSVGAGNDYGHPADATLEALRSAGVPTLRTDLRGSLALLDDKGRLSVVASSG